MSEVVGSSGNSMLTYLRNCQAIVRRDCTISHSRWQCVRAQMLHVLATLVLICLFYILAALMGMTHVIFNDMEKVLGIILVLICFVLFLELFIHCGLNS